VSLAKPRATPEHAAAPARPFDVHAHAHETTVLGMWVFLATELMLFGGLFTAYAVYRYLYAPIFREASGHLHAELAALNTAVLILSSLTVALAIHSAQTGGRRAAAVLLGLTLLLGAAFLAVKGYEYFTHFQEGLLPGTNFTWPGEEQRAAALFFSLYYAMTGLHALHMLIGLGLIAYLAVGAWRGRYTARRHTPLEVGGLYWHFVDVVWVFIFPMLYLIH
jgi:cytochrome c oxidase subunit III